MDGAIHIQDNEEERAPSGGDHKSSLKVLAFSFDRFGFLVVFFLNYFFNFKVLFLRTTSTSRSDGEVGVAL